MKIFKYKSEIVETVNFLEGKLSFYSHPCPTDDERTNEDSCAFFPLKINKWGVLVVCDGLGGHENGAAASKTCIEALEKELTQVEDKKQISGAIIEAIDVAHKAIKDKANNSGTTLVLAIVMDKYIRFYHVGDSIGVLMGSRGAKKFATTEHSFTGYAMEAGLLKEREALEHPDSHLVHNALGLDGYHIEVSERHELSNSDLVLLASDGLTANMLSKDVDAEIISGKFEDRIGVIVDKARGQMMNPAATFKNPDDLTMLLYQHSMPSS